MAAPVSSAFGSYGAPQAHLGSGQAVALAIAAAPATGMRMLMAFACSNAGHQAITRSLKSSPRRSWTCPCVIWDRSAGR